MHLRLSHKLFLLLLAPLVAALLALSAVTAFDLRSGFTDYLRQRDVRQTEYFADLAAAAIVRAGGVDALRADPATVPRLLAQMPRRGFGPPDGPPTPLGAPPPDHAPPPGLGPPPGTPPGRLRAALLTPDLQPWAGEALPANAPSRDVNVVVGGRVVAVARGLLAPAVPLGIELDFLRREYRHTRALALILGVLMALAAWLAARAWARPLVELRQATSRIAAGDFAVRLAPRGGDELADALHNINSMAASLGELEKTRRIWLAQISHELRTPLTALSGELDALLDSVRPLTIEAVESLREEVTRLARLIDDLHLVALADVRALPCQFAPDDAAAVVRQAAARFAPRAATAGLELVVAGCEAPVAVCWDTRRIEQLLANLLANAVRYTDAPGRIVLHAYREGNATVLDVRDSKPGVPPDRRIRLLEPLFRVEESRDRNQGGSGLGLSVCAAIARAHGGTVELDQSDLGGLRVCVRLPARAP